MPESAYPLDAVFKDKNIRGFITDILGIPTGTLKQLLRSMKNTQPKKHIFWKYSQKIIGSMLEAGLLEQDANGKYSLTHKIPPQGPDEELAIGPSLPSPSQEIQDKYSSHLETLKQQLIAKIKEVSPQAFEKLTLELLIAMGYGNSTKNSYKLTPYSKDKGIDGIIKSDPLGLDLIYIQAKQWTRTIGRPEIAQFVGDLLGQGAKKGVFMTTSQFSKEAKEYTLKIDHPKLILIDGSAIAEFMIEYNYGVGTVDILTIKKIDEDYFREHFVDFSQKPPKPTVPR